MPNNVTRKEFCHNCHTAGYANYRVALAWAKKENRAEFDDSDYEKMCHETKNQVADTNTKVNTKYRLYEGTRTTRRLKYISPDNWNPNSGHLPHP